MALAPIAAAQTTGPQIKGRATIPPHGAQARIAAGDLRAGAAKVDITPPATMLPLTAGQLLSSIHDPIFARALVLDNGSGRIALITADVTTIPNGSSLLDDVSKATGIARDRIILSATHNHNAPTGGAAPGSAFTSPYYPVFRKGVLDAVMQATGRLQPARVGFGTGKAYVNVNRDEKIGAGYHMGYDPEGPSDKTVAVLSITTPAGKPIAVYTNYAVHGVVMYRAKTKGEEVQVTSDLPGWTSNYVEERLGNGAVALWASGAAGDQNPMFQATYNQDAPDVHDEKDGGWALLDVQSRRLGQEVVRITGAIANTTSDVRLWGQSTAVSCPGRQRAEPARPGTPGGGYLAPTDVKMVDGDPVSIPLTLLMVNDTAVAGVSGEVFTEIGQHLKAASPFDRTMMVTVLAEGIGYIPTDKAFLLPSEKALTNRLKPGCAEPAIIGAFKGMMDSYITQVRAEK